MLKSLMRHDHPKELLADINVTPLVDICLVLVIIFMVTTAMFLQPPFEVKLPTAHAMDQDGKGGIFVALAPDGGIAVNEAKVTEAELPEALALRLMQSSTKWVIIRADGEVPSKRVLAVLDMIKQAGAWRISFGTKGVDDHAN